MEKQFSARHAFLIIAHEKPMVLKRLVKALDHPLNNIFIHIDKKCDIEKFNVTTQESKVIYLDNRIDGRWGDYSLVEIEIQLIEKALEHGTYDYLHLISGVDYPIKSMQEIHAFCAEHKGKEFIGFGKNETDEETKWRSQHYFLFSKDFKSTNLFKRITRKLFVWIQTMVGYSRYKGKVIKGSQWWSITSNFAEYILQHKSEIQKYFHNTYCPDELFAQTLCWNSQFRSNVYNIDNEFESCKRYIPWRNGALLPLSHEDFLEMKKSEKWFGRKFSEKDIDKWIEISKYQ